MRLTKNTGEFERVRKAWILPVVFLPLKKLRKALEGLPKNKSKYDFRIRREIW